jgi:hypothetical protein
LLTNALEAAKTNGGYWLNTTQRMAPRFYPKGVSVSAFNPLHWDCIVNKAVIKVLYTTTFNEAKTMAQPYWPNNNQHHSIGTIGKSM